MSKVLREECIHTLMATFSPGVVIHGSASSITLGGHPAGGEDVVDIVLFGDLQMMLNLLSLKDTDFKLYARGINDNQLQADTSNCSGQSE
jgi:hypothetical protein